MSFAQIVMNIVFILAVGLFFFAIFQATKTGEKKD